MNSAIVLQANTLLVAEDNRRSYLQLIDTFLQSVDIKPTSRASYKRSLSLCFSYLEARGYFHPRITIRELLEYKDHLVRSGLSSLSIASYLSSVKSFYSWLSSFTDYPNISQGLKLPKRVRKLGRTPLSKDKATELVSFSGSLSLRDRAIVNLLLRTGLRTIEVSRANIGDIQILEGKRVLVVQRKGSDSKDSLVVLTEKAYKPIQEYLESRGRIVSGSPLFVSDSPNSKGERLSTRTISKLAKESLKSIGLPDPTYTAHSLRHTAGTLAIQAGQPLSSVQDMLGHTTDTTTRIYVKHALQIERILKAPEEALDSLI